MAAANLHARNASLFPDTLMAAMGADSLLLQFVDRYTFEATLPQPPERPLHKKMVEDEVRCSGIDITHLRDYIASGHDMSVTYADSRISFEWPEAELSFPASYELISGMSRNQCEARLLAELSGLADGDRPTGDRQRTDGTPLMRHLPDTLFTAELSSRRYTDDHAIIFSPDRRAESLANLLTGTDIPRADSIAVSLRVSTYEPSGVIELPLRHLIAHLLGQGFHLYCGVENPDDDPARCLLVASQPSLGFAHTLHCRVPASALDTSGSAPVIIRMHPFIPVSRIRNLFND